MDEVLAEQRTLAAVSAALAELDHYAALAELAIEQGYVRPRIDGTLVFDIEDGRHPMRVPIERPHLTPDMRRLMTLSAPGVIAGGMAQLTMVISTIIATLQDRVVSWLYYADRIFQLPLGVIGVAIGVVLLPDLSHKLRSGDHDRG